MLEMTKPPKRIPGRGFLSEQDSLLGFRREENNQPDRNPNTLGLSELI
jgi:hypothetical protein